MSQTEWQSVDHVPALSEDTVQVWYADLAAGSFDSIALLSADERRRAAAFHFERDRLRFVAARTLLRRLLAAHVGRAAAGLELRVSAAGKPYLGDAAGLPDVRFNVSHSHEAVLLAFALGTEVGIDAEQCRRDVGFSELADRFFCRQEASEVRNAGESCAGIFYDTWSRKEACVKAVGAGLQVALDQFSVCRMPGDAQRVIVPAPGSVHEVVVYTAPPLPSYSCALATVGAHPRIPVWLHARGVEALSRAD